MENVKNTKDVLSTLQTGTTLAKQINELLEVFRPYKPEVKRFRIDHMDRSSEIKYLLQIPSGLQRKTHRKVELPATTGFRIDEVLDLDKIELLDVKYDSSEKKWLFNANDFPNSESFMVTLKGQVSQDFLDRLVSVKCAHNPTRDGDNDCYWIHSALKDVSILERIWDELDVDRVNADIRIGVERFFSSSIPKAIKDKFEIQRELLYAISHGQRNIQGLQMRYRRASRKATISPSDLVDVFMKLVSGEYFSGYVKVDDPFRLGSIEPLKQITSLIPDRVKVAVLSDINLKTPAVKGQLTFERQRFVDTVTESVEDFQ